MDLKRRQELYLDGLETSLVMTRICYARLRDDTEYFFRQGKRIKSTENFQIQILLDAWSLVDTINRLRILVTQAPGLKKNSSVMLFQKDTEGVELLRHFVQHLSGEIPKLENTGWPLLGSLTWVNASPEMQAQKTVSVSLIIPGRLAKSEGYPLVNPIGLQIEPPVDHISLTASTTTIDLSDLSRSTIQFETKLKAAVARAKEYQKSVGDKSEIMLIELQE